jgi:hypothetical protein
LKQAAIITHGTPKNLIFLTCFKLQPEMKTVNIKQKHMLNYSIYGVQFHPERVMTQGKNDAQELFLASCYKLKELTTKLKTLRESLYDILTAITAGEVNDSQIAASLTVYDAQE